MLKVLFQELRDTLTTAFERHVTVEDFPDVDQNTCEFFLGYYYHETKMDEGACEVISWKKIRASSSKKIGPRHFTYYCIPVFLSNKPSF